MKCKCRKQRRREENYYSQRGVISIFLAGVLLLTSLSTGVMFDFARWEIGKAEARSGLRLASHQALSGFYKRMAREFGLFVVEDRNRAQAQAEDFFERRWPKETSSLSMVRLRNTQFTLSPTERSYLSYPHELENQIDEFMEWQLPQVVFGKIIEHLKLLENLSQTSEVMKEKLNYEQGLQSVQERMENVSSHFERLSGTVESSEMQLPALPSDFKVASEIGDHIFTGLPAMESEAKKIESMLVTLDHSLSQCLTNHMKNEEVELSPSLNFGDILSPSDKKLLSQQYERLRITFRTVKNWWKKWHEYEKLLEKSLDDADQSIEQLEGSASSWANKLEGLPDGSMTQNFLGDYLAETSLYDTDSLRKLKTEFSKFREEANSLEKAWINMTIDGVSIEDLSFDGWLEDKLSSITNQGMEWELLSSNLSYASPEGWTTGIPLSEDSIKTQAALLQMGADRSSLWEAIQAMWKKHKITKQVREAKRKGLPNLTGGIETELTSDALARYQSHAMETSRKDIVPIVISNETETMNQVMQQMDELSNELSGVSIDAISSRIRLLTYWATMFSHRTTSLLEEREGQPRISLNGFPLKNRPIYSGELEFILHGRGDWMTNIKQTEYRIAAIRLICNMAYAFSSSELYMETAQLATALAGWTGFAVPFVQSTLLLILSLGETAFDMEALTSGERVPVIKTIQTWRFSLNGVSQFASESIKDVFDFAEDELFSLIDASAETVNDSISHMESSLKGQIQSAVQEPTLRLMEQLLGSTEMPNQEKMENKLKFAFSTLASRGGNGKMGHMVSESFHTLENQSGELAKVLCSAMEEKQEAGLQTEKVVKQLQSDVKGVVSQSMDGLENFVSEKVQALTKRITEIAAGTNQNLDESIHVAVEEFRQELGATDGNGNMGVNAGLMMDYEDYIYLFLILYSSTEEGKNAMLSHTAQLVQVETEAPDLTLAPTSLDWSIEANLTMLFFPQFDSTQLLVDNKKIKIKEEWSEGYGTHFDEVASP